jgi:hypothetical protein
MQEVDMMKKIVTIDYCNECLHFEDNRCSRLGRDIDRGEMNWGRMQYNYTIPDDCPLPNKDEEDE